MLFWKHLKQTEPRQIFRDDVEKLKNRPHRPAKPEFYEDEEYQPPSSYDLYQSDFESYFEPSYPNYPIDQEDDYYQKPNYKPSHRPSYHDKTNSKHRVPNYTPKPQTYQEDYQAYHSKPSYPSHESIYDRPEYDTPKYSNDYKNEHKYGNKYENDHSSGYSSGYENEHTNTKPYDDKYFKPEVYRTKPRPTYPKEVILLQPGPAVKAIPYQHKPEGYNSGAVPGTPGKDYPNYSYVPETSFKCPYQSDYEQMYSDPEAGCQVSLTKSIYIPFTKFRLLVDYISEGDLHTQVTYYKDYDDLNVLETNFNSSIMKMQLIMASEYKLEKVILHNIFYK